MAQSYSNDIRERIAALVLGGNVPGGGGAAFRASGAQYGQRGREAEGGKRPYDSQFAFGQTKVVAIMRMILCKPAPDALPRLRRADGERRDRGSLGAARSARQHTLSLRSNDVTTRPQLAESIGVINEQRGLALVIGVLAMSVESFGNALLERR